MNRSPRRLLLAASALAAVLAAASPAAAQPAWRFSARADLGASLLVSSPQSNDFGLGFAGRGDLGVRVVGPLHLRAFGQYLRWPASSSSTQAGNTASAATALVGGGLSVEPAVTSRIRLRFEGDLAVSLNGASSDTRLSWGGAVGAWFGLGDNVDLGPVVRVGAIQPAGSEEIVNGGPGAAFFLQFGVAIAFHGADAPAAPEPQPYVAAPPPPAPVVVVAPQPAAPMVSFGAPTAGAGNATFVAPPVAGPVVVPVQPVGVVPAVVPVVEEPRGRHHRRRHREGRHGGRHREGGSRRHHRRH